MIFQHYESRPSPSPPPPPVPLPQNKKWLYLRYKSEKVSVMHIHLYKNLTIISWQLSHGSIQLKEIKPSHSALGNRWGLAATNVSLSGSSPAPSIRGLLPELLEWSAKASSPMPKSVSLSSSRGRLWRCLPPGDLSSLTAIENGKG